MTRLIYVQYLTDCLHIETARPGKVIVWCNACKALHRAVELRKIL